MASSTTPMTNSVCSGPTGVAKAAGQQIVPSMKIGSQPNGLKTVRSVSRAGVLKRGSPTFGNTASGAGTCETPMHDKPAISEASENVPRVRFASEQNSSRGVPDKVETTTFGIGKRPKRGAKAFDLSVLKLAEGCGVPSETMKRILTKLPDVIAHALNSDGVFDIPGVVILKQRTTKPRESHAKSICGREVIIKAKPSIIKVTTTVQKKLVDTMSALGH